jgi:2-dehydropantoate 2-reductase
VTAESHPTSATGLAVITTKSHHTREAAEALAPVVTPDALVLSLQNGVENVGRADEVLGAGRVLAGQAFVGVWIEEPGTVDHGAEGRVSVGDPAGGITPRALRLHGLLTDAWDVSLAEDIVRDQWRKLLWNAGFNALCAITGRTAGDALALPESAAVVRAAMQEVVGLAAAHDIHLSQDDVEEMARPNPALADYHPSTARDLAAGKQLERDALCGFIARDGRARGVPTPVNDTLDALLGLRERPR